MTSPIKFGTQAKASHALLALVYLLPVVYSLPSNYNVILTATLTVFAACWRTSSSDSGPEVISKKEALRFPLVGSISLLSLFLAVKFLSKEWVNVIITCYFCLMGVFAVSDVLHDAIHAVMPHGIRDRLLIDWQQVKIPLLMPEPEPVKLSVTHAICGVCGTAFTLWYSLTKHYLANNGLGIAYCLEGISMLNLGSTQIGVILLSGLFLYDIFWVFGTPVMVTVAKSIDGPIKLLFKRAVKDGVPQFGMLGLGDIVIPGIFLALMLQFDHHNNSGHVYFHSACAGYVVGLGATIWVMNVFDAAQPALLYIVPAVLGAVFLQAAVRGEVSRLWLYNHGDKQDGDEAQDGSEDAQPKEDKKLQ